jgi:hypothetical protein
MKPMHFLLLAALVVVVLVFWNNQQGLLVYITRTFLNGVR